ncbi:MAG: hypothetical protein AAF605_08340 [Myxococcota bacterium]
MRSCLVGLLKRPRSSAFPSPVQVLYRNLEVDHLYSVTLRVENHSPRDFSDLVIELLTDPNAIILEDNAGILGTSNVLRYESEYEASLKQLADNELTPQAGRVVASRRKYKVPVLNRWQCIDFRLFINDTQFPARWVEVQEPGVRTKSYTGVLFIYGVPVPQSLVVGFFITALAVALSTVLVLPGWAIGAIGASVGLFAAHVGAGLIRAFFWAYRTSRSESRMAQ